MHLIERRTDIPENIRQPWLILRFTFQLAGSCPVLEHVRTNHCDVLFIFCQTRRRVPKD